MSQFFYVLCFILISAQWRVVTSIVTPSVKIKEENPPANSRRVIRNPMGITEIIALVGEPLILECIPRDVMRTASVFWTWQGKDAADFFRINTDMRSNDISKYKITKGTSAKNAIRLEIPTVTTGTAGQLICKVQYMEDSDVRDSRIIKVFAKPRIVQYRSSFESEVKEGKNVTLRCNATGIPMPRLFWRRIGGSSAVIRGYGRGYLGSEIKFDKVRPNDRGLYMCEAVNTMSTVLWPVRLNVLFQPQVRIYTDNVDKQVFQRVGCRMQLLCIVTSNPRPSSLQWTNSKGKTISETGTRVRTYTMEAADFTTYYSINFNMVEEDDYGRYTCTARNTYGARPATVDFRKSDTVYADRSGRTICSSCVPSVSVLLLVLGPLLSLLWP